jgi:hypothetical protein
MAQGLLKQHKTALGQYPAKGFYFGLQGLGLGNLAGLPEL